MLHIERMKSIAMDDFEYIELLSNNLLAEKLEHQAKAIETGKTDAQIPSMEFTAMLREASRRIRIEHIYPDNYNFD